MKRILCLWLPDWPAQRARKRLASISAGEANATSVAIALHARDPRRGDCIAACDSAARGGGIRRGMPLAEARALFQRTQTGARLRLAAYDAAADRQELRDLAVACERYSPLVGLGETSTPSFADEEPAADGLLLDVTSIGVLFGGEDRLAEALLADLAVRGYAARLAIADTISAAWGLAHFSTRRITIIDAASSQDVSPGWQALQTLPLEALRVPRENVPILRELGLESVAQLAALPRPALGARFGARLVQALDRAEGLAEELILPVRPAPEFQAEWLLEHPISDRQALQVILEQLAQRVGEALRLRDQGAVKLACRLDVAGHAPQVMEIGLYRPAADPRHFLELLRLQGEVLHVRGAIGRVRLEAVVTARLEHRQKELFAAALDNKSEELALLINRLSNRLGRQRVGRPRLTRDAIPERAWELEPLTAQLPGAREAAAPPRAARRSKLTRQAASRVARPAPTLSRPGALRPLVLLSTPAALEVLAVAPDGPPISFVWQGSTHRIACCFGPERIETAWWRGASVRRDYYRVETQSGCRFWLFRELRDGQWYLHGDFG